MHNLWVPLIFWHIYWVLGHILESYHDFWIVHASRTSGSMRISLALSSLTFSTHPPILSIPRKPTEKHDFELWAVFLLPLPLNHITFFLSFLQPLYSVFFPLILYSLTYTFSSVQDFFLNFFQDWVIIIIQFTGKAGSWAASSQRPWILCFSSTLARLSWIMVYFNGSVTVSNGSDWLL